MKTQSAKNKGRILQQRIVKDIKLAFPHLSENDVRSTSMGCAGEDVILSPLAKQAFPYSIEAKNQERVNVWQAIKQCETNCKTNEVPAVVLKRNQCEPHVILPWTHFLEMTQKCFLSNSIDDCSTMTAKSTKDQIKHARSLLHLLESTLISLEDREP